jgi:hypothetical protein
MSHQATRTVDLAHGTGVPKTATAVLTNLTVTNTAGAGFLAMFSAAVSYPGNSSINWFADNCRPSPE